MASSHLLLGWGMINESAYLCFLLMFTASALSVTDRFILNGFKKNSVNLDEHARITSDGLLHLTDVHQKTVGHAVFPSPFHILNTSNATPTALSFSTTFVFDITSSGNGGGYGLAFVMAPSETFPHGACCQYIGLFGMENNGQFSNHMFAVEFDTAQGFQFFDIDDNHVGVDVNSVISSVAVSAAYYTNDSKKEVIKLKSGQPIQVWIDYDGVRKILNVTISPFNVTKPRRPLISYAINLSPILKEYMYVGFSSATGTLTSSHYILGWSFRVNGAAQPLNLSKLRIPPSEPDGSPTSSKFSELYVLVVTAISGLLFAALVIFVFLYLRQRSALTETLEDWELDFPHRFPYKDLYKATKGFKESEILGSGGFGQVYKGFFRRTGQELAIKRICNSSKQGAKEFIAEIVSLGQLKHRNLVHLEGWCKRNNDLILVYEFMHHGSLDMFLYDRIKDRLLSWEKRFKIVKDIALAILYLHEEWAQVVLHRDIKASNVLLDAEMNGRLGDFGLAKLHGHGANLQTTHVVGTVGYVAPELSRTGKATTGSDVYAFGMLVLEVVCGRRPVEFSVSPSRLLLLDWVRACYMKGQLLEVVDPKLRHSYVEKEAELVLYLGLVCTHPMAGARFTMRQVTQYLDGKENQMPEVGVLFSEADTWDMASRSYPNSNGSVNKFHTGRQVKLALNDQ